MKKHVLIVDDDRDHAESLAEVGRVVTGWLTIPIRRGR